MHDMMWTASIIIGSLNTISFVVAKLPELGFRNLPLNCIDGPFCWLVTMESENKWWLFADISSATIYSLRPSDAYVR